MLYSFEINRRSKKAIIKRVLERGNENEINEIIVFYGKEEISNEIKTIENSRMPSFKNNAQAFNLI